MQEAANAVDSATAASTVQQEEILLILDENEKEEVDLVPDSDDDEDWGAPMRGQAPLPLQTAPVGLPLLKVSALRVFQCTLGVWGSGKGPSQYQCQSQGQCNGELRGYKLYYLFRQGAPDTPIQSPLIQGVGE